ncbi:uncharacterized protein ASPGLDRAFT_64571 [Aspergillus glaucus CBS 516.65]|uniref:Four-carbon acid sugar kinase nucleotide binding domain-containing protein n=1 Tax=Aspergillus glaucus CBS 516.65 TaxID=1160497 RepID=A0A1L9VU48_ASPGL|nr:hypothetical protein ASPGLDRAFT_64571 [Aspergillus glaucus CBS 516.65]OJJ87451.1 hypothetical protein ASPGLDRAFT_64571 [Aspergillus glaucus CBS 516.65]
MMQSTIFYPRRYEEAQRSLPAIPASGIVRNRTTERVLVVLDDDPTGTQTVHNVAILTTFEEDVIEQQRRTGERGFFILTNSRAFPSDQASKLLNTILNNLRAASETVKVSIDVVLRSDSTLRGHFPLEPQLVDLALGPFGLWVLAPAFFEGGRVTVDDVQFVHEGDFLVPVANTPFAQDRSFGFSSSNLREWIVEKFDGGDVPDITSIGISDLRRPDGVEYRRRIVVLNAFSYFDFEIFIAAEAAAQNTAPRLYRTGASFITTRLGIEAIPPLPLSWRAFSIAAQVISQIKVEVPSLLKNGRAEQDIVGELARQVESVLTGGCDCIINTCRKLIHGEDASASLSIGNVVSDILVRIVQATRIRPRYMIAKGGTTSSDIATKALNIKRARILGQAATGVPLWRSDGTCDKWPGIPYIVFPGNVGSPELLGELVSSYHQA